MNNILVVKLNIQDSDGFVLCVVSCAEEHILDQSCLDGIDRLATVILQAKVQRNDLCKGDAVCQEGPSGRHTPRQVMGLGQVDVQPKGRPRKA